MDESLLFERAVSRTSLTQIGIPEKPYAISVLHNSHLASTLPV